MGNYDKQVVVKVRKAISDYKRTPNRRTKKALGRLIVKYDLPSTSFVGIIGHKEISQCYNLIKK